MGNKRDDFAWLVAWWEDLVMKNSQGRSTNPRNYDQTTSYDYAQWKKREKKNNSMWIIWVILAILTIIVPLLLH